MRQPTHQGLLVDDMSKTYLAEFDA